MTFEGGSRLAAPRFGKHTTRAAFPLAADPTPMPDMADNFCNTHHFNSWQEDKQQNIEPNAMKFWWEIGTCRNVTDQVPHVTRSYTAPVRLVELLQKCQS